MFNKQIPTHADSESAYGIAEAADDGAEFFGVDQTERQHRLVVRDVEGGIELVVVHGPKCPHDCEADPGDTSDVLHLSPAQCQVLASYAVRNCNVISALRACASAMRDGGDPERVTFEVMAALMNGDAEALLSHYAHVKAEMVREHHHR